MTTYYSQKGEDSILEKIFEKLKIEKGWFVDVGAWNGIYLSNTYLFFEKGWSGIEIEADRRKFGYLLRNFLKVPNVYPVLLTLSPDGLDKVLSLYPIPNDFDLLSIDIDSYDYWIWSNLKEYSPKIVIIESNGRDDDYIQPPKYSYKGIKGAGKSALKKLAEDKGYIFLQDCGNLIFARKDTYENL